MRIRRQGRTWWRCAVQLAPGQSRDGISSAPPLKTRSEGEGTAVGLAATGRSLPQLLKNNGYATADRGVVDRERQPRCAQQWATESHMATRCWTMRSLWIMQVGSRVDGARESDAGTNGRSHPEDGLCPWFGQGQTGWPQGRGRHPGRATPCPRQHPRTPIQRRVP